MNDNIENKISWLNDGDKQPVFFLNGVEQCYLERVTTGKNIGQYRVRFYTLYEPMPEKIQWDSLGEGKIYIENYFLNTNYIELKKNNVVAIKAISHIREIYPHMTHNEVVACIREYLIAFPSNP